MRIDELRVNTPKMQSFGAIKTAQLRAVNSLGSDIFVYTIEKDKDLQFCKKLKDNLLNSNLERLSIQNQKMKHFIKNSFSSLEYADKFFLGVKDRKPFGLMSVMSFNSDKDFHLAYFTTWKTPELKKVKEGGSQLMDFLFNRFKNSREITLTPAFSSEYFYYKFGFDFENEIERNEMHISGFDLKDQLNKFSKKYEYKEFSSNESEDISKIADSD